MRRRRRRGRAAAALGDDAARARAAAGGALGAARGRGRSGVAAARRRAARARALGDGARARGARSAHARNWRRTPGCTRSSSGSRRWRARRGGGMTLLETRARAHRRAREAARAPQEARDGAQARGRDRRHARGEAGGAREGRRRTGGEAHGLGARPAGSGDQARRAARPVQDLKQQRERLRSGGRTGACPTCARPLAGVCRRCSTCSMVRSRPCAWTGSTTRAGSSSCCRCPMR